MHLSLNDHFVVIFYCFHLLYTSLFPTSAFQIYCIYYFLSVFFLIILGFLFLFDFCCFCFLISLACGVYF